MDGGVSGLKPVNFCGKRNEHSVMLTSYLLTIQAVAQRAVTRAQPDWLHELEASAGFGWRPRADEEPASAVTGRGDPDGDGIVGEAGKDYPVLRRPPADTSFECRDKLPGIYADMDTGCQVYHICQWDERMESSMCVNGTVFNQESLACDWWYNVDCASSHRFYWVNSKIGKTNPNNRPTPPTSDFDIQFAPPPPSKKLPFKKPSHPDSFSPGKKPKQRPEFVEGAHYGRHGFDPALNVPTRTTGKKFAKASAKQSSTHTPSSPLTHPVNSDDVIAGYSDLYINKPVDED